MPNSRKNGRFVPDPAPMVPVPVGDPIDTTPGGKIHKVASWCGLQSYKLDNGSRTPPGLGAETVCGLKTGRLRQHYPTRGEPCPKCWPNGICSPVGHGKPRLVVDNSKWFEENPF